MKYSSTHYTIVLLATPLAILFSLNAIAVESEYLCEVISYSGKYSATVKATSPEEAEKKAASVFERYDSDAISCYKK